MPQDVIVHTQSGHVGLLNQGVVRPECVQVTLLGYYLPDVENIPSRLALQVRHVPNDEAGAFLQRLM
jgi:hypothetical protein